MFCGYYSEKVPWVTVSPIQKFEIPILYNEYRRVCWSVAYVEGMFYEASWSDSLYYHCIIQNEKVNAVNTNVFIEITKSAHWNKYNSIIFSSCWSSIRCHAVRNARPMMRDPLCTVRDTPRGPLGCLRNLFSVIAHCCILRANVSKKNWCSSSLECFILYPKAVLIRFFKIKSAICTFPAIEYR